MLQHGELVAEIPNPALTDEAPLYKRPLARWEPPVPREKPDHIAFAESGDFTEELHGLLSSPNISSKRWVWQQYDHMVQTNTVEAPGAGDAGVIRIKGSNRGLAMARHSPQAVSRNFPAARPSHGRPAVGPRIANPFHDLRCASDTPCAFSEPAALGGIALRM